jgi:hypothetical protein
MLIVSLVVMVSRTVMSKWSDSCSRTARTGKHASMVKLQGGGSDKIIGHPLDMNAVAIDDPNPDSVIPTSQVRI